MKRLKHFSKSNKLVSPKKRIPRKHQKAAVNDAVKYFYENGNSRGKLIMPCGTGKSLTAFWMVEKCMYRSKETVLRTTHKSIYTIGCIWGAYVIYHACESVANWPLHVNVHTKPSLRSL